MANDLSNFQAESWSARMVAKLDQVNVALPLVNRNWEGDLRVNKTVWVRTPGAISMATYTRGTTISYNDLTPSKESFTVNGGEYFAFEVDDLDRAQNDLNAMDVYMKRAIVAMNNAVESKILGAYTNASNYIGAATGATTAAAGTATVGTGTLAGQVTAVSVGTAGTGYSVAPLVMFTGSNGAGARATATIGTGTLAGNVTSVAVTAGGHHYAAAPTVTFVGASPITLTADSNTLTGVYTNFTRAAAIMSKNNVPRSTPAAMRWALIDPDTTALLQNDTDHFVRATEFGDQIVQFGLIGGEEVRRTAMDTPGFVGRIAGFNVYETPHIPTSGTTKFILFGDNEAISYAAQITEIEALRLQTTFANAVRGLLLHDVFVPEEGTKRLVQLRAAI